MITAKFGGTALTPKNLAYLKQCIGPYHKCVVVSAVGKEGSFDEKTTDLLIKYYNSGDERFWRKVEQKYRRLVEVNGVNIDIDYELFFAHSRALKNGKDYCMSLGEELSAKVTAKFLNAAYIEAEQIIRFGARSLQYNNSLKNIRAAFNGVELAVTGGFYGGSANSRRIFPRGGSDITGAVCAAATNSSLYENWTDSYGVCVANPAKVFDVSTVLNLSYDQMFALSQAGAEVLHPSAVKPCKTLAIPIKIGNFYNPYGASTIVSNCPSQSAVLSVAEKNDPYGNVITTVLHALPQSEIHRLFCQFFKNNMLTYSEFGNSYSVERNAVFNFSCNATTATVTTKQSIVAGLYKFLKNDGLIG